MKWAYGVTAVLERHENGLLKRTLASLAAGGFDSPWLFVDGDNDWERWRSAYPTLEGITCRFPKIRTFGNWILSMSELYIRNPTAERFAIFQDDFITVKNLRGYLECWEYPDKGYLNLYTFPSNQDLAPKGKTGFYPSNQWGRGAVATVFSLEAVMILLQSKHFIERPQDVHKGHRSVDGGIVSAFKNEGWREFVHNPSLTQHTGETSTMGNVKHKLAVSYPGEDFDALSLLATPAETRETVSAT